MTKSFGSLVFTPVVKALQERYGSRRQYARIKRIGDARLAAWSYREAYAEVGRISGLVSFEPDIVAVQLDGRQLRLEPGQAVIPHGPDRELTVDEARARR
jgi:hypothetical protein